MHVCGRGKEEGRKGRGEMGGRDGGEGKSNGEGREQEAYSPVV